MPGDGSSIQCLIFRRGFPLLKFFIWAIHSTRHLGQWTSSFLIVYALLIWQGISSGTPWKWNSLVHSTLFLSECIIPFFAWNRSSCITKGWSVTLTAMITWQPQWKRYSQGSSSLCWGSFCLFLVKWLAKPQVIAYPKPPVTDKYVGHYRIYFTFEVCHEKTDLNPFAAKLFQIFNPLHA